MIRKSTWQANALLPLLLGIALNGFADPIRNPCGGPSALLSLVNRPTVADSACVVPFKHAILELGYQYQWSTHSLGQLQTAPTAVLRIGLPFNNEFVWLLPNYLHQTSSPGSGFGATTIGIKHELGYNTHWLAAIETLITPPSGSNAFGSNGLGAAVNGIVSYTFNSQLNLTFMLGGATQTQSYASGGQRYSNINPDLVLTYSATAKLNFFAEVYGQSKTGPGQQSGFNTDGGLLYLALPNLSLDLGIGQRISGQLATLNHFIGAGMSILF